MLAASPPNSNLQPSNEDLRREKLPLVTTILHPLNMHLLYSLPSRMTVVPLKEQSSKVAIFHHQYFVFFHETGNYIIFSWISHLFCFWIACNL